MTVYKAQQQYTHGAHMCTVASIHWVLAICVYGMPPEPSAEQMHVVMRSSERMYIMLTKARPGIMLQQHEVITGSRFPATVRHTELFGTALDGLDVDPASSVQLRNVGDKLTPGAGAVFTANRHTTALYRSIENVVFMFDSCVASVEVVGDLTAQLCRAHGPIVDFCMTVFSK